LALAATACVRQPSCCVSCAANWFFGSPALPPKLSDAEVDEYRFDLRQYNKLRAALQNWSDAFVEEVGRRPDRHDVDATKIPCLSTGSLPLQH
jgi:hypothetical protein